MNNITINQFVTEMGWTNEKYYSKIVNGYTYKKTSDKKYSIPTINYLFGGINHAMTYHENWKNNKEQIKKLIIKHFANW